VSDFDETQVDTGTGLEDARLCFLARALPVDSFAGDASVGPLDVESALARVLSQAALARQVAAPDTEPARGPSTGPARGPSTGPSQVAPAPRRSRRLRWTTWVGAAMVVASFSAPWLVRTRVDESRTAKVPSAWLAGVTSTSAVVFWGPR
jgi:hypothetical protein